MSFEFLVVCLRDRAITARIWDRRSEPRERVMGQVLTNLEGFAETVALTKEKGA